MDTTSVKHIKAHLISKLLLAIAFIYFVLTRIKYLDIPLDRDEGSYLYMGKMFIRGYVPYVDFYEIKPPGIFLVYGLYDLIFGFNNLTLHLGLVLVQLGMTFLVYKIILHFYNDQNKAILGSAILLFSLLIFNFLGFAILSEYFFIICILNSILLIISAQEKNYSKYLFWAGFLFGLSAMIRQHAIFYLIPVIYILFESIKTNNRDYKKCFLRFIAGGLTMVAPILIYILARGSFDEMFSWVISNPNQSYADAVSWDQGMGYLSNFLKGMFINSTSLVIIFISGLIATIFLMIKDVETRRNSVFVLLFLVFSFASIFPGLRFYGHYWLMFLPVFAIVGSNCYVYYKNMPTYIVPSLITIAFGYQVYSTYQININSSPKLVYQFIYGDNPNPSLPRIVDYLNRRLKNKDEIYVFGSEPQIYYQCNKVLKIPHVFLGFVHSPGENNEKFQQESIDFLTSKKPEYILHIQNVNSINMKENSSQTLYQWIFSFEKTNYHQLAVVDIDSKNVPSYYFDKDALNYKPLNTNYMILYQKNN